MGRSIVLFGATGYTGRLVADALVARDARPLLAARNEAAVRTLAAELGGLETAVADVARPETLRAIVGKDTVLVSTVGPFMRWGGAAVQAATDAGAVYLDSTGEPPFIREVFERHDQPARASGATLVTAFGYDFVPGNLAAALALERAGERAVKASVGYFLTGGGNFKEMMSGGTAASAAGVMMAPHFAYRDGRVATERPAKRVRSFDVGDKQLTGISIGCSEHLSLPRLYPSLREVDVYLGWFGPASRAMQGMSLLGSVPGVRAGTEKVTGRFVKGSTGGPRAGGAIEEWLADRGRGARHERLRARARGAARAQRLHLHRRDPGLGRTPSGGARRERSGRTRPGRRVRLAGARGRLRGDRPEGGGSASQDGGLVVPAHLQSATCNIETEEGRRSAPLRFAAERFRRRSST
jgi:hypothetical protein